MRTAPPKERGEVRKNSLGVELSTTSSRTPQEVWTGYGSFDASGRVYLSTRSYGVPTVFAVVRDAGKPIDIACFPTSSPEFVFTVRGEACLIGLAHFDHCNITGERLRLRSTVKRWITSGGTGCAVADWLRAAPLLAQLRSITCDDDDHAMDVQERLARCGGRQPRIYVAEFD